MLLVCIAGGRRELLLLVVVVVVVVVVEVAVAAVVAVVVAVVEEEEEEEDDDKEVAEVVAEVVVVLLEDVGRSLGEESLLESLLDFLGEVDISESSSSSLPSRSFLASSFSLSAIVFGDSTIFILDKYTIPPR